jgi:hypothetical protein
MFGGGMGDQAGDVEFEDIFHHVRLILVQHLQQSAQFADFGIENIGRKQHVYLLGGCGPVALSLSHATGDSTVNGCYSDLHDVPYSSSCVMCS